MSTYDASGLSDLPRRELRAVRDLVGDFVLVGMAAVDLVVRGPGGLGSVRLTRDVDIAIEVDSEGAFRDRTSGLVPRGREAGVHFREDQAGAQIDVLPYGGMADDDRVRVGDVVLDVSGLDTVAETAAPMKIEPGLVIRVAGLAGLVVLKILAWTDRSTSTGNKDAHDLALLLRASASGDFADEAWEDEDALAAVEYDIFRAGPWRVGRQIVAEYDDRVVRRLLSVISGPAGRRLRDVLDGPGSMVDEQLDALVQGLGG